jgi:threonyl-tRNA synthetase
VAVLGVSDVHKQAVIDINDKLKSIGIRSIADLTSDTVSYKIRNHSLQKIPFVIVLGDKEIAENTVAVRKFGETKNTVMSFDEFISLYE